MKQISKLLLMLTFAATIFAPSCKKKDDSTSGSGPYFARVKSIIQANCLSCHSSSGSWSGRPVAFDSDSAISAQYASIKVTVADPVTATNPRMPQGGSLSTADINTIVSWFSKGGKLTD